MASTSLRKFSACLVRSDCSSSRVSLVTPSTRPAISLPNRRLDLRQLDRRVLDHVVQQAGGDRGGVEPVAGQDVGDRDGMGDVGIAVVAALRAVRLHGQRRRRRRSGRCRPWGRRRGPSRSARTGGSMRPGGCGIGGAPASRRGARRAGPSGPARPRPGRRRRPPLSCGGYRRGAAAEFGLDRRFQVLGRQSRLRPAGWRPPPRRETSCRPKMFWSVGMRSSTSSSAGSGSGARDSDLIRSCSMRPQLDRLLGDFAQRDDGVLVVVAVDGQFLAAAAGCGRAGRRAAPARTGWGPSGRNLRR